jgi:histidyl-tRNA synthetase
MQDVLPEDMLRFRHVADVFRESCQRWGYHEVRTPTLEYLHLFTSTGTLAPSMLRRVYSFLDWDGWSGERVVLKPDGTIPIARLYIDNFRDREVARLFYVTNIFAFEGTGREKRERWQYGAEFLGGAQFTSDVEVVLLAREVIYQLGLGEVELKLSHAGLVKALVREFGLSFEEEAKVLNCIREGDWSILKNMKGSAPWVDSLLTGFLDLQGGSSNFLQNIKAISRDASADFKSALDNFISITSSLDILGCDYSIDIKAISGFEYYTGVCFHFLSGENRVGGGGRYDDLIPLMGGSEVPACGFALYADPIMELLPWKEGESAEKVLVKGKDLSEETVSRSFSLARLLRDAGYMVELGFDECKEAGYRWFVSVFDVDSFSIMDCERQQTLQVNSEEEILAAIRG